MNNLTDQTIDNAPATFKTSEAIKLSNLQKLRIEANKDYKTSEGSISKMLKNYIEFGQSHLSELNKKHGTNLTSEFIRNSIETSNVSIFLQYLTEKEKAQSNKRGEKIGKSSPVFTFWLVQSLISRYCEANKVKK